MSPRLLLPLCYLAVTAVLVAFFLPPPEGAEAVAGPRPAPARDGAAQPVSAANEAAAAGATVAPATAPSRSEVVRLSGTLRVAGEGEPLSCVRVRLDPGPATETDTDGRFALAGLAPGEVRVRVEAVEGFGALDLPLELRPGDNHVALELAPRFDLRVLVVRHAPRTERDREPVAGARVLLRAPELAGTARSGEALAEATCDEQGRCDLRDLSGGEHELVVQAPGHAPTRILLPFRHRERGTAPHLRSGSITVALAAPGIVLRGRVLGPGRTPVAGALVCLDDPLRGRAPGRTTSRVPSTAPPVAFSDASGAFDLPLPEGVDQVALLVCPSQESLSPIARHEVLYQHLDRPTVVLVPAAEQVELRVVRSDGRPAAGRLQVSDGVLSYDLRADPQLASVPGLLDALAPAADVAGGSLRLRLPVGGYRVRFDGDEPGTLGAWFVQVDGAAARTLELRLPAPSGEPSGGGL